MKCKYDRHVGKGRFKILVLLMIIAMVHAQAYAAVVRISWNANTDSDLAGYNVYYGTATQFYSQVINAGKFTSVEIDNLKPGQTYYMAVTAYNQCVESDFSDEISIKIPKNGDTTQSMDGDGESGGGGGGCFIAVSGL